MAVTGQGGLNKNLRYVASKGLADIGSEGLAPSTTDSQMYPQSTSDVDSVGEDTNSPAAFGNMPETGLPAAEHHEDPVDRNKTTR